MTPKKIFSPFSVRRQHHRLGPKHKDLSLNPNLSHFRHSVMGHLASHLLRIGMSAITGATPFRLCNRMYGVPLRQLSSHLCLVPKAMYGAGPPGTPQVRALAPSGHQRRQVTRKLTRTTCLGISGAVSSRCHLDLSALVDMLRTWQPDSRIVRHRISLIRRLHPYPNKIAQCYLPSTVGTRSGPLPVQLTCLRRATLYNFTIHS
jgi:hypothetical protein